MPGPVDPSFSVGGPEWSVEPVTPATDAATGDGSFAGALGKALGGLQAEQQAASDAALQMATGRTEDPTAAIMALERARLSMQLAGQIRTKAIEAFQDVIHTQV
jgi:flagellar hook-basal body complex protein FliE